MNYTLKLLIPTFLGLAAAGINWVMLASKAGTVEFVTVKENIEEGDTFELANFERLDLPLQFESLVNTAIPYAEVGLLEGKVAQRSLTAGDLLFFRDTDMHGLALNLQNGEDVLIVDISQAAVEHRTMRIGDGILFRIPSGPGNLSPGPAWIGPFRIVTVGSSINNDGQTDVDRPDTVGVAYKQQTDSSRNKHMENLEKFCDAQALSDARVISIRVQPIAH